MSLPIRRSVIAGSVAALLGMTIATELGAQSSRGTSPIVFALTGITADQMARLTVSAVPLMERGVSPGPCRASLTFVDQQGRALTNSDGRALETQVALQPGESAFLDLHLTAASRTDGGRLNFRPVVVDQGNTSTVNAACVAQLEIIDNATQSTLVINPGVAVGGWQNHNETLVRDLS